MFCQTKAFLALVTVICLIQSFQWYAVKQKQPVYKNTVKMYGRLFFSFFWRLLKIIGDFSSLSTQLFLGTDEALPSQICHTLKRNVRLLLRLSSGNQSQPLSLGVSETFFFWHNSREIALHREQEIILTSSLSVGTLCKNRHAWAQLKCRLPCKSYVTISW